VTSVSARQFTAVRVDRAWQDDRMTNDTTLRSVTSIIPAVETVEGEGMIVRRPFPTAEVSLIDPFLLLDHLGPVVHGPGEAKGTPNHPHRGFETVTYFIDGGFEHRDSLGNEGHLGPGSVQWMTAGSGVIHSEKPDADTRANGGPVHGFQLWVNLRAQDKMIPPRYQDIPAEDLPVVETDGVWAKVIAGSALGATSPVNTHSPVTYVHARIQPGASIEIPAPMEHTALVYVVQGAVMVGSTDVAVNEAHMAYFANDGTAVTVHVPAAASRIGDVLILIGEPLREPVARYGPFVMNTREEILQAFADYDAGTFAQPVS
jgi:redox-sensitive bicupin YhaK (pirin superfamily)